MFVDMSASTIASDVILARKIRARSMMIILNTVAMSMFMPGIVILGMNRGAILRTKNKKISTTAFVIIRGSLFLISLPKVFSFISYHNIMWFTAHLVATEK